MSLFRKPKKSVRPRPIEIEEIDLDDDVTEVINIQENINTFKKEKKEKKKKKDKDGEKDKKPTLLSFEDEGKVFYH